MNKFKVGDIVVLRNDLVDCERYDCLTFASEMRKTFNEPRKVTVSDENDNTYRVEGSPFWFSEKMLDFVPKKE